MKNIQTSSIDLSSALKIALLLSASISLAACGGTPAPVSTLPANPQAFFDANGAPVQTQNVTLDGSTTVSATFAQGTRLTFAPGSVIDAAGNPYTGTVVLSVREIASKSDMLLSNVLTISDSASIVSGGMFNLDLKTPAGAALNVNPVQGVAAAVPVKKAVVPAVVDIAAKPMQQFVGSQNKCGTGDAIGGSLPATPIAAGDSSVNWCPVGGQFGIDNTTPPGSYVFSIFQKGWINCDFFYSDPRAKTTLRVTFDAINDNNTVVFMIPQGINTVIALYTKDGANKRKSYDNLVPIGLNTELVALTFNAGKQYLAHKTITVAANATENLTFSEATTAEIKAYLTPLNQ